MAELLDAAITWIEWHRQHPNVVVVNSILFTVEARDFHNQVKEEMVKMDEYDQISKDEWMLENIEKEKDDAQHKRFLQESGLC